MKKRIISIISVVIGITFIVGIGNAVMAQSEFRNGWGMNHHGPHMNKVEKTHPHHGYENRRMHHWNNGGETWDRGQGKPYCHDSTRWSQS